MLGALRLADAPGSRWQLPARPLMAVIGFSFVVNLMLLVPALFVLQVFDRVFSSGSRETLLVLVIGVTVALLISLALDHLRSRLQGLMGQWLGEALLPDVARELLARGARTGRPSPPDALRDVGTLRGLFSAQGLLALIDAPWALVYIAVIWLAHPVLGVTAALSAVLMLVMAYLNDRMTRRDIEALQKDASAAQRYLESSLVNAEVAEAMGMTDALIGRWRRLHDKVQALQSQTAGRSVGLAATTRAARQGVQVIITAVGAYLVVTQSSTPGVMVATTLLLGRALAPVEQVVASWKLLIEGRAAAGRLRQLLASLGADKEPALTLPRPTGALEVNGLVWRPAGTDRMILYGVSFALQPKESVAIIGPSGAGKSTLLRLLAGLWSPTSGSVRLDGAEVDQWPRHDLGPHIGYVPQDVELFTGTVAENIARMGDVDSEAVVLAAQTAKVHDMILALPEGYETALDTHGSVLSPGQRQRIALARALYGRPQVVLLDEPNANLDGAGEQALGEVIAALRGQVTLVIVTHRTTLLQHVDKLLMIEGGRAKHFGPVGEVLQAMKAGSGQVVAMPRSPAQAESRR